MAIGDLSGDYFSKVDLGDYLFVKKFQNSGEQKILVIFLFVRFLFGLKEFIRFKIKSFIRNMQILVFWGFICRCIKQKVGI